MENLQSARMNDGQVVVRACEWLSENEGGACFRSGTVAREGSFHSGDGTRVEAAVGEDLAEVCWSAEV